MNIKLLTEQHLEFLSLKGGCTDSSKSTPVFPFLSGMAGNQASQFSNNRDNMSVPVHHCGQCGKGFPTPFALKRHYVVHTGEKPYSCHVCGKKFTQKANMKTHMIVHRK